MDRRLTPGLAFLILAGFATAGNAGYVGTSVYSALVRNGEVIANDRFDCSDSIYVFTESENAIEQSGDQSAAMTIRWLNPHGKQVRVRTVPFNPTTAGSAYSWDGIALQAASSGSPLQTISQFLDPSDGMTSSIGTWTVKVSVGSESLPALNFEVLC